MREAQVEALESVLERVRHCPGGIVEIDLDLTALMPVVRTRRALEITAVKTGVREFADSDALPVLPGYSPEAWVAFLRMTGLPERYPDLSWYDASGKPSRGDDDPYGYFHSAYWTTSWLIEDEPTPGLCSWVSRVEAMGGRIVFLSGRWLPEHVAPTMECLRRSGISDPVLLIGNDSHESLVGRGRALSDAAIKAARQAEIRDLGEPAAFIDDRPSNRVAVQEAAGGSLLTVAITIPGFTHDADNETAAARISTFEMFDDVLGAPPRRPYLFSRYGALGEGLTWNGLYEGLGVNKKAYAVRRSALAGDEVWRERLNAIHPPYTSVLKECAGHALEERDFVRLCEQAVPGEVKAAISGVMDDAVRLGDRGVAAPYPGSVTEQESLYHALLVGWLHSRDIEIVMRSLGFALAATGVHDIVEYAPAAEVRKRVFDGGSREYSPWLLAWVEEMPAGSEVEVNVGCFDPAMAVGMWRWHPDSGRQDAMDVHRLSSHHEGDGNERYDPLEAAVNNLLHRREGISGIRKEPVESWRQLAKKSLLPSEACAMGKAGLATGLYRDLVELGPRLERAGYITPWCAIKGQR